MTELNEISQLQDFDIFFYYGQSKLEIENKSDLLAGLVQPSRSMYYNRQDSAGVSDKENNPNTVGLQISVRYNIVRWSAYRNSQVTDGQNNTTDRRIAISQNSVNVKNDKNGNVDINVLFIPLADFKTPQTLELPGGGII